MLKVVVADDEERICRLIQALVDWKNLGFEIVGIAGNGVEALECVREKEPDILITDIRMPGCSGLELIEKVKSIHPSTEIVIISGYAHFEYAQTAIKYGVGDYLLKPINKEELTATLEKLGNKIVQRNASWENTQQDMENREKDIRRLRENLISDILAGKEIKFTMEQLEKEYHLQFKVGIFQGMVLKIDYENELLSKEAYQVILEKISAVLEKNLSRICYEFVFNFKNSTGNFILNYADKKQDEVRRTLKDCLSQLEMQKPLLGPVDFSIALGTPEADAAKLSDTLEQSQIMIAERLVKGTGTILDGALEPSLIHEKNYLEQYLRNITQALEILSEEELKAAVEDLETSVSAVKRLHGYELQELVNSAAGLFLTQIGCKDKAVLEERFGRECENCSSQQELFEKLIELQEQYMEQRIQERDNDASRPVRMAKQYIQNHYNEQITLEEVSENVGLSAAYFSSYFKKEIGEGFARYLIRIRMEQAKIMLRETNLSVAEICRKTGYNDVKHFTYTFEKMAGVKPGTYRKLYG